MNQPHTTDTSSRISQESRANSRRSQLNNFSGLWSILVAYSLAILSQIYLDLFSEWDAFNFLTWEWDVYTYLTWDVLTYLTWELGGMLCFLLMIRREPLTSFSSGMREFRGDMAGVFPGSVGPPIPIRRSNKLGFCLSAS